MIDLERERRRSEKESRVVGFGDALTSGIERRGERGCI
jgi:hypothetical protein